MDRMPNVVDRDEVLAASEGEAWSSPFAGGLQHLDGAAAAEGGASTETGTASWVASPFAEGLLEATGSESESAFKTLLAELHDEGFEEALQGLIDEAAGRYLTAAEGWSGESGAGEVEAWLDGIATRLPPEPPRTLPGVTVANNSVALQRAAGGAPGYRDPLLAC
jgi:hypothetical protein